MELVICRTPLAAIASDNLSELWHFVSSVRSDGDASNRPTDVSRKTDKKPVGKIRKIIYYHYYYIFI